MHTDHEMEYTTFATLAPGVQAALLALGKAIDDSGLDKSLTELVKLRASMLNGCSFCLQFHFNIARRIGIEPVKLDQVGAWRDATCFSPRERAALALTDAMTRLGEPVTQQAARAEIAEHFTPAEQVHLSSTVAAINAWNRIAMTHGFVPPPRTAD